MHLQPRLKCDPVLANIPVPVCNCISQVLHQEPGSWHSHRYDNSDLHAGSRVSQIEVKASALVRGANNAVHVSNVRALAIRALMEGTHWIRALHLDPEAVPSRDGASASVQQSECLPLRRIAGPPHHSRGWPVPRPVPPVVHLAHQQACSMTGIRPASLSGVLACPMVIQISKGPWSSLKGHSSELKRMCKLWPHPVGWMATQRPAAHPHLARHLQPCQEVEATAAALLIMRCQE